MNRARRALLDALTVERFGTPARRERERVVSPAEARRRHDALIARRVRELAAELADLDDLDDKSE